VAVGTDAVDVTGTLDIFGSLQVQARGAVQNELDVLGLSCEPSLNAYLPFYLLAEELIEEAAAI
jgi:hypothetical protein